MDISQSSGLSQKPRTHQEAIKYCTDHEISPNELLIRGATIGSIEEMRIARLAEGDKFLDAFYESIIYGHLFCSFWLNELQEELSLKWDDNVYDIAMIQAAMYNRLEIITWLYVTDKCTHCTHCTAAFSYAAGCGHLDAMDLIIKLDEQIDYTRAIDGVVRFKQFKAIKAMKRWNVLESTHLLTKASQFGSLELMVMAKEWGATNYTDAKNVAIRHERSEAVDLLTRWQEEGESKS